MPDEMTMARTALLDAIEALEAHLEAIIVVGAQAIYLHTGSADVAIAEFTTDGPVPRSSAVGTWISRRGVRVPPHDSKAMRRARGLEAALVDSSRMSIGALDPVADPRDFIVAVAGPAALLVAKIHKLHDRIKTPCRLNNKDAHDVYRLLRAIETYVLSNSLSALLRDLRPAVVRWNASEGGADRRSAARGRGGEGECAHHERLAAEVGVHLCVAGLRRDRAQCNGRR